MTVGMSDVMTYGAALATEHKRSDPRCNGITLLPQDNHCHWLSVVFKLCQQAASVAETVARIVHVKFLSLLSQVLDLPVTSWFWDKFRLVGLCLGQQLTLLNLQLMYTHVRTVIDQFGRQ